MKPILNQNNTIITTFDRKKGGYNLYETSQIKKVSEDDDYQILIGPLRFFIPLYESPLCFFVGTAYNINFPPDQIIIWDESKKRKAGIILLKGACDDLKVRKEFLICLVEYQLLIFDIFTMELILILEDCNNYFPVQVSYTGNPAIIAYQSRGNPTQVKAVKLKLKKLENKVVEVYVKELNKMTGSFMSDWGDIYRVYSKVQYVVSTFFEEIIKIELSNNVILYSFFDFKF
jgi:hypothetical protein